MVHCHQLYKLVALTNQKMFDLVKFNQVMVIIIQMIQLVKKQIDKYAISKTPKASLKLEYIHCCGSPYTWWLVWKLGKSRLARWGK